MFKGDYAAYYKASAAVEKLTNQQRMLPGMIAKLELQQSSLNQQLRIRRPLIDQQRNCQLDLFRLIGGLLGALLIWMVSYTALSMVHSLTFIETVLVTVACYLSPAVLFYIGTRLAGLMRWLTLTAAVAIFAAIVIRLSADVGLVVYPASMRNYASALYVVVALVSETLAILCVEQIWIACPAAWRRLMFEQLQREAEAVDRELAVCRTRLENLPHLLETAIGWLRMTWDFCEENRRATA